MLTVCPLCGGWSETAFANTTKARDVRAKRKLLYLEQPGWDGMEARNWIPNRNRLFRQRELQEAPSEGEGREDAEGSTPRREPVRLLSWKPRSPGNLRPDALYWSLLEVDPQPPLPSPVVGSPILLPQNYK